MDDYRKYLDESLFYTKEELASIYDGKIPSIFTTSLWIKDENLFNKYSNEQIINIDYQGENYKISECLIHDILTNEGMLRYIYSIIDSDLGIIRLDYIIDDKTFYSIKFSRSLLGMILIQMFENLQTEEKFKAASIMSVTSPYSCNQKYRDKIHKFILKDKMYEINASEMLNILLDDIEFDNFLSNETYKGYDKKIVAYAIRDFIERERIFSKYTLPEETYERYIGIANYKYVDFEALVSNIDKNNSNQMAKDFVANLHIDDELIKSLDEYKIDTYSKLELAIYYYIRLCEILTFDKDAYIDGNEENKIENITLTNNRVTSYSFILIYACILNRLGIEYAIDQTLLAGYFDDGTKLTFEIGEYLIGVDSLNPTSNDLINECEFNNIHSINKNDITKKKFNELLEKISNDIKKIRGNKKEFEENLIKYESTANDINVSFKDKLYIMLKSICKTNLKDEYLVEYEKTIFNNLFGNDENIKIHFVYGLDNKHNLVPTVLISYLDGEYQYILVRPNMHMMDTFNKEELEELLFNNKIYYADKKDIPGINKFVGGVYAK